MTKSGYVYIMTNKNKSALYIGVTNDLFRRVYEHKNHLIKDSFSDKYNLEYCIYYEVFAYFDLAINREKELKKWNRQKKENLINKKNPEWKELVNEKGFIRNATLLCSKTDEIPHSVRNDSLPCENRGFNGSSGGYAAAAAIEPLSIEIPVIPNGAKRNEESAAFVRMSACRISGTEVFNGAKRNVALLSSKTDEIPHSVRNDSLPCENRGFNGSSGDYAAAAAIEPFSIEIPVIPNGAKRNEESAAFVRMSACHVSDAEVFNESAAFRMSNVTPLCL